MNTRVEGHTPLNCPFCGISVKPEHHSGIDWVWHPANDCTLAGHDTVLERWNRRASIERLEKVNEALMRALEACEKEMRGCETLIQSNTWRDAFSRAWGQAIATLKLAKEPA